MSRQINKKNSLLARKNEILKELDYYEARIKEAQQPSSTANCYYNDDSSDSEIEICLDVGPSITELKLEQRHLKTCLQATQELSTLNILESEVNVLEDIPVIEFEPPVTEEGVWQEVIAECRVDLVPFSMSFCVHKPYRFLGPKLYRNLKVVPVNVLQEKELAKSVLSRVTCPSDAVELLKNYAKAHRARRSTLARLDQKFSDSLFMKPLPEGGYVLKCGDLLKVSWTLQNKSSALAPFRHRFKFNVENMDESYIKIVQTHRLLLYQTLDTNERTLLMAKIIATCLEAQKPAQELYESMNTDSESVQNLNERCTLDNDLPNIRKAKDTEIMAPPKSLPKIIKKARENMSENSKAVNRPITEVEKGEKSKVNETHRKVTKATLQEKKDNQNMEEVDNADELNSAASQVKTKHRNKTNDKLEAEKDKNEDTEISENDVDLISVPEFSKPTTNKVINNDRESFKKGNLHKNYLKEKSKETVNKERHLKDKQKDGSKLNKNQVQEKLKVYNENEKTSKGDLKSAKLHASTKFQKNVFDKENTNKKPNNAQDNPRNVQEKSNVQTYDKLIGHSRTIKNKSDKRTHSNEINNVDQENYTSKKDKQSANVDKNLNNVINHTKGIKNKPHSPTEGQDHKLTELPQSSSLRNAGTDKDSANKVIKSNKKTDTNSKERHILTNPRTTVHANKKLNENEVINNDGGKTMKKNMHKHTESGKIKDFAKNAKLNNVKKRNSISKAKVIVTSKIPRTACVIANPTRISPRKIFQSPIVQETLRNSQKSPKHGKESQQKPFTNIPKLLKKPVLKT